MIMSDKNPKHPLKKKKVAAKVNMADHEGQGAAQYEVLCAPCPFFV